MRKIVLLATLLLPLPAFAAATNESVAKEHSARAKALIIVGDLRGAIKEFDLAFRANPKPNYLYNIAELHRRLGEAGAINEMRSAADFFQRYLDAYPNAEDRAQVEARIAELRARIESAEAAARDTG